MAAHIMNDVIDLTLFYLLSYSVNALGRKAMATVLILLQEGNEEL